MTALVIAHRTCPRDAAENSIAGIRHAARAGADAVEVDVRVTADGQPVLMHDPSLWRTTRRARRLDRTSLAEVRGLRLRGSEETVPTLADALAALDGQLRIAIDVKDPAAADAVLSEVRNQGAARRVLFWAKNSAAVALAAEREPELEASLLRDAKRPDEVRQFLDDAVGAGARGISCSLVGDRTDLRRRGTEARSSRLRVVQDSRHLACEVGDARRPRHGLAVRGRGNARP